MKYKYLSLLVLILVLVLLTLKNNIFDFFYSSKQVKIIWMYWEQGEENLKDKYNKMCIYGWRKLNPDWEVRVLDKNTVIKYIPEIVNYNHLTVQSRADVIRIKLLNKYGGVWADASTLPLKRLTGNIENMHNNTDIFFYRSKSRRPYLISNWFIYSKKPNHYLINKLDTVFSKRVIKKKKYRYFYFHETLTDLYDTDPKIKDYIDTLTITNHLSRPKTKMKNKEFYYNTSDLNNLPLMFKRNKNIKKKTYKKYLDTYISKYL